MNKHILQWLKDELESHGNNDTLILSWDEFDKIFDHVQKHTNIKLK